MNNFERIKSMSMEEMAWQNVKSITYMSGYQATALHITSDGYECNDKQEAIAYELNWLKQEVSNL